MIIDHVTNRIEIPHEPGEFMVFNRLNWTELEDAKELMDLRRRRTLRDMGADVAAALVTAQAQRRELEEERPGDREAQYDALTLLKFGIASWSYTQPVTPETIKQLDARTKGWAALAILDLSLPKQGDELKNSEPPYIDGSLAGGLSLGNGRSPEPVIASVSPLWPAVSSTSPTG